VAWRIDDKDLIEPRNFEDRAHVLVYSAESKHAPIFLHVLHSANQDGHPGTVDEGYSREIDHDSVGVFPNHGCEGAFDAGRPVQVNFPLKGKNICGVGCGHPGTLLQQILFRKTDLSAGVDLNGFAKMQRLLLFQSH
jgi:hypothetical protein